MLFIVSIKCKIRKSQVLSSRMKLLFCNVQSLNLNFDDVACDYNVQAAEVNICVETRLCPSDCNTTYEMTLTKIVMSVIVRNSSPQPTVGPSVDRQTADCQ